jgi:hypothetical protein
MHEFSTRAWNIRRQASATKRGFLAAVLVLAGQQLAASAATMPGEHHPPEQATGTAPIQPAYDAAIQIVDQGNEGLQLSARLAEDSEPLQQGMSWKVIDATGVTVAETEAAIIQVPLQPGSYHILATYGSAVYRREIELPPGQRLSLGFLLNAGAIRILATVEGLSLERPATNLIYAASGAEKGKLVTVSRNPGEVLRLASGKYRLESRLEPGNAVLVTDVDVRPGTMSSLNVAHNAGLLRVNYAGASTAEVSWQVLTPEGQLLLQLQGAKASALLRPGDYLIEMLAAGKVFRQQVELLAGDERYLTLGR